MTLVGLIFNFIFNKEYINEILLTSFFTFIFTYIMWELSYLNAGDVKLLTVIPLYLPYRMSNPIVLFSLIIIFFMTTYYIFNLIVKIIKKDFNIKDFLKELKNYFYRINYFYFFTVLFSLSILFYFINLNIFTSLLITLVIFLTIDRLVERLELNLTYLYLIILLISIFVFYKNKIYQDPIFYKNLIALTVLILFIRIPIYLSSFFSSTKKVEIEKLKIGDKLALIPIKKGNVYSLEKLIPYNLFSLYFIKKYAIDNYDPSIGLQKENIKSIRAFFKKNHIKKVEIFEEIPFVPLLLLAFLAIWAIYFYNYFRSLIN